MVDENRDPERREITEESLEQVAGGAMVVRPNIVCGDEGAAAVSEAGASIPPNLPPKQ